ncbi:MAG: ADP-ribosylation factor-like protein [Promethearchaeota archaeon]
MDTEPEFDYLLCLNICGDEGVGKYSLRRQYMGTYVGRYHYGCYVGHPLYRIEKGGFDSGFPYVRKIEGKRFTLFVKNIFDTPRFKQTTQKLQKLYYHGTHGVFILFDLTDILSFNNVRWWIDNLLSHLGQRRVPITIIGNKRDLYEAASEPVSMKQIGALLVELKEKFTFPVLYQETDCKSGDRVEEVFNSLVTVCINWVKEGKKNINSK